VMAKFANVVQAKAEMSMTKEQLEEVKKEHIKKFLSKWNPSDWEQSSAGMQAKIKEIHKSITKMEADRYDLEKRLESQTYELKELNERQRQVARNEARKMGVDPSEAGGKYKPKVQVMARGERQIDRRNFKERRRVFLKKHSVAHFPNTPPKELPVEKVIKPDRVEEDEEEEDA